MKYFDKWRSDYSRAGTQKEDTDTVIEAAFHLPAYSNSKFLIGCTLVSLGILVSGSGGSWDITNHLLNKPETFFSAPHAVLYLGVASSIVGATTILIAWRSFRTYYHQLSTSVKLVFAGIGMLLVAGPVDFAWHSAFGLDGLLSPPHFVLLMGMIISSFGSMLGIIICNNATRGNIMCNGRVNHQQQIQQSSSSSVKSKKPTCYIALILTIIGVAPVWISTDGLIGMFTLPFSKTQYFDFNPDPSFAAIFATISYPFLLSLVLYCSFELGERRFGVISIIGGIYLTISTLTAIMPSESLVPTLPFYVINILPIVAADGLLSVLNNRFYSIFMTGAILGSIFFMIQYPLITHIYNEVITKEAFVWPSLTSSIYFGMIGSVYPLIVVPAIAMGILGAAVGYKLTYQIRCIY